jgi:hypothetical protein
MGSFICVGPDYRRLQLDILPINVHVTPEWNARSWYVSGAYRFTPHIELGSYYSFFTHDQNVDESLPGNHIYDKAVTARFDLKSYWTVKVEGHFIDGYGGSDSTRGFYNFPILGEVNTMKPQTNMLLVRTGFSF